MTKPWITTVKQKVSISKPIFIEGLPGIGNVGKVAIDFLIDQKKLKPFITFTSPDLPHAVFIQHRDFVDLPCMNLYHFKVKKQDFIFLAGDVQPLTERSCYQFCAELLEFLKKLEVQHILTLGGIGLADVPAKAGIYLATNNQKLMKQYKKAWNINHKTQGTVDTIVGVTGLLVGLAKQYQIPALAVLVETYGHPQYIGVKEARVLLDKLQKTFRFGLSLDEMDQHIDVIEKEVSKRVKSLKQLTADKERLKEHITYIG